MTNSDSITLLGSAFPTKGERTTRALAPGAVAALASGGAESLNPKKWTCEDSVVLHRLPDGSLLAGVADAHYGGYAGEAILEGIVEDFGNARGVRITDRLIETVRAADARLIENRPVGDESESTVLLVHVQGRTVSWVSIGDSYLLLCGFRARILNQQSFQAWPRYVGAHALAAVAPHGPAFDHDQVEAKQGEVVLLATDGIETRSSGIELADIVPVVCGPGSLEDRIRTLQALCDRPQTGGGRDNLGMVAIEIA